MSQNLSSAAVMIGTLRVDLCIQKIPKQVLLQTVKTQMKCHIMRHFIRVYTVSYGKKDLQTKNLTPLAMYN